MNLEDNNQFVLELEKEIKKFQLHRGIVGEINSKIKIVKMFYIKKLFKSHKIYTQSFHDIVKIIVKNMKDIGFQEIANILNNYDIQLINGYNMRFQNKANKVEKLMLSFLKKNLITQEEFDAVKNHLNVEQ